MGISRAKLLASTVLLGSVFAVPAVAQTATPTADVGESAASLCAQTPGAEGCSVEGEVVVTGSRIASRTLTSSSPLQVVDARDIADSGVVNVQELLLENPAFGSPGISRTNSAFSTSSAGVASVDLRNLGSSRTLTLVNGRRMVAGVPGTSTVDLNTIPADFIDRVDVLTGGASSVYGSDAVAGVVNFIYKTSFEGLQLRAQSGITEHGDGAQYILGATMGANIADGRGNVIIHAGYTKEEAIGSRQRNETFLDDLTCTQVAASQGGCAGTANYFTPYAPFLSGFAPNTTVTARPGFTRIYNGSGALIPVNTNGLVHADGVPGTTRACTTADPCTPNLGLATGFNRQAFRTIALPIERYLVALRGRYAVTDSINVIVEGTYAKSQTTTLIEPFAYSTAGVNGSFPATGGYFNIETRLANGTVVRNPFVSDALYNEARDQTGDGLRDVSFTKRLTEFGPRTYTVDRQTFRVLGGLEGKFLDDRFSWDMFYSYGQTTESQVGSGQVNLQNFAYALEVIPGANGPVCANAVAQAQGCVAANVFGPAGSLSAGAINYIQAAQTRNVRIEQTVAGGNLSGNLFDLWDGPLGAAVGFEYRKERSSAVNDPLSAAGLNGGNALPPTRGEFDVIEGYGEVSIPLLADRPFFKELTLTAAGRVSDYSTVGTVYSWNYGGTWAPISDIRFRVVDARATRAPNIGELFGGRSQTFPTGLVDPCIGVTAATADTRGTTCRAAPGVNANIAANGSFTINQADLQGVSGFGGGNPNLGEEVGRTFTAGVVINPTSVRPLRNFAVTVDYWNIRIKDAIVATPRQFILDQCYRQGDPTFCAFITRRPTAEGANSPGSLSFIDTGPSNSGGIKTNGIDATVSYRQSLADWGLGGGSLNARVAYTYVNKYDYKPLPNSAVDQIDGEVGAPKHKASVTLGYDDSRFGLTLRGTYLGKSYLDDQFRLAAANASFPKSAFKVPAVFYLDTQARFRPTSTYELSIGVDNVLDKKAPNILSGLPGNSTGTDTAAGVYDPIGRRFYVGARLKF